MLLEPGVTPVLLFGVFGPACVLLLWHCGKGEGGKDGRMVGDARSRFPSPWSMQMKLGFRVKVSASGTASKGTLLSFLTSWLSRGGCESLTGKAQRRDLNVYWRCPQ